MNHTNKQITGNSSIAIYEDKDKKVRLDVTLSQETVWLTQEDIAKLFRIDRSVITKHLRNIFNSKELEEKRTGSSN